MICPSCHQSLEIDSPFCPNCEFQFEGLKKRYGAIPRYSAHLTDTTNEQLGAREFTRLLDHLLYFERVFPQGRFSVFIAPLQPQHKIEEYTFWLLNTCQFTPYESRFGQSFSILLVIDVTSNNACMMTGYGLEPYLPPAVLQSILEGSAVHFSKGELFKGIKGCIHATIQTLREAFQKRLNTAPPSTATSTLDEPSLNAEMQNDLPK